MHPLAALLHERLPRTDESEGPPPLTWGQPVSLGRRSKTSGLRGFDDGILIQAAPYVHNLIADLAAADERRAGRRADDHRTDDLWTHAASSTGAARTGRIGG